MAKEIQSKEEASKALEQFVKYPIYHYLVKRPTFPIREKNDCKSDCNVCESCFPNYK